MIPNAEDDEEVVTPIPRQEEPRDMEQRSSTDYQTCEKDAITIKKTTT